MCLELVTRVAAHFNFLTDKYFSSGLIAQFFNPAAFSYIYITVTQYMHFLMKKNHDNVREE